MSSHCDDPPRGEGVVRKQMRGEATADAEAAEEAAGLQKGTIQFSKGAIFNLLILDQKISNCPIRLLERRDPILQNVVLPERMADALTKGNESSFTTYWVNLYRCL